MAKNDYTETDRGSKQEMIGIVILNYSAWEDTKHCVKSICKNTPVQEYTIIVVDNASDCAPNYDLSEFIKRYRILFIQNTSNLGYNAGNNVGIAKALEIGCSYILISNSDVRYFPESILKMRDYLKRNPQAGIVGPKILDAKGRLQKSNLCRKTGIKEKYMVRTKAHIFFRRSWRTYFGYDRDYEQCFEVYAVLGCCFMMSELCARTVAPFDEYPVLYEEELMLGIRMEEAGFRTVYNPDSVIKHLHGRSTSRRRAFAFAQNVRSEIYYCRSYLFAPLWQIYPLCIYRVVSYALRCVKYKDFRKNWKYFILILKKEL